MPIFNDENLENWKESEIWTDSLWMISERDKSGKHSNFYHGNFVPQIPRQFILRYTKKNDIVFNPFVGSGTTAYEAEGLKRRFVGFEIVKDYYEQSLDRLNSDKKELLPEKNQKNQTLLELMYNAEIKEKQF